MKTALLLTSLLLPAVSFAKPIATLTQGGGFCPPDTCPNTSISLEDNGAVVAITTKKGSPTQQRTLAFLGKELMQTVIKDIQTIKLSKIVDQDPDAPMCADIPQTTYTVFRGKQPLEIAYDRDCHEFRMDNGQGQYLVKILRTSLDLYYYSSQAH